MHGIHTHIMDTVHEGWAPSFKNRASLSLHHPDQFPEFTSSIRSFRPTINDRNGDFNAAANLSLSILQRGHRDRSATVREWIHSVSSFPANKKYIHPHDTTLIKTTYKYHSKVGESTAKIQPSHVRSFLYTCSQTSSWSTYSPTTSSSIRLAYWCRWSESEISRMISCECDFSAPKRNQ
ncbi:unnamed protein product [Ectocarpus sp. 13 AM-2016]